MLEAVGDPLIVIIVVSLAVPVSVTVIFSSSESDDISEKNLSHFLTIHSNVLSSPAGPVCCLELQASIQDICSCSLKHKNNQTRFLRDHLIAHMSPSARYKLTKNKIILQLESLRYNKNSMRQMHIITELEK